MRQNGPSGQVTEPNDRERLERFLAWRRKSRPAPAPRETSQPENPGRRLLPYVAAVSWLGLAIITGATITTLAAGARGPRARVGTAPTPGQTPITGPIAPTISTIESSTTLSARPASNPSLLPVTSSVERGPAVSREERGSSVTSVPARLQAASRSKPPVKETPFMTTAVGKVKRWVGPEVRAGKAIVRWVRAQPSAGPGPSARHHEPDVPQAR